MKTIKERNAEFDALDKWGKRVAVANEVMSLLSQDKIEPRPGTYIGSSAHPHQCVIESARDVRKALASKGCRCCARGALFVAGLTFKMSTAKFSDHVMDGPLVQSRDGYEVFTRFELNCLESAFESRVYGYENENAIERFKDVFGNLIVNKGHFYTADNSRRIF